MWSEALQKEIILKKTHQGMSQKVSLVGLCRFDQVFLSEDVFQSLSYVVTGISVNLYPESDVPVA